MIHNQVPDLDPPNHPLLTADSKTMRNVIRATLSQLFSSSTFVCLLFKYKFPFFTRFPRSSLTHLAKHSLPASASALLPTLNSTSLIEPGKLCLVLNQVYFFLSLPTPHSNSNTRFVYFVTCFMLSHSMNSSPLPPLVNTLPIPGSSSFTNFSIGAIPKL